MKVSQESEGQSLIESGLQGGESVIVEGQSRVTDGAAVQPKTQTQPSPTPSQTTAENTKAP